MIPALEPVPIVDRDAKYSSGRAEVHYLSDGNQVCELLFVAGREQDPNNGKLIFYRQTDGSAKGIAISKGTIPLRDIVGYTGIYYNQGPE